MELNKNNTIGLLLCLAIATASWILGNFLPLIGGPVFAILIGMIVTQFIKNKDLFQKSISFTSKKVLQYAVILLGFGLNLSDILKTGLKSLPVIISTILTALIIAYILYKVLKMPSKISTLIGVGSAICGGSAIAATAPVINADDDEVAQAISVIFLFNITAAIIFPSIGELLGLSNYGFGLFAGTAVNDTSSVTAVASAWDSMHNTGTLVLDHATIVKLTRTLAIIPITLILAFYNIKKQKALNFSGDNTSSKLNISKIFPTFILFFVLASIITTLSTQIGINTSFFSYFKTLSKFFIVMAMGAIGLNTNIVKLIKSGGKPILMGLCCWVSIACVSLFMQKLLNIW